jgi:hypothetical protein
MTAPFCNNMIPAEGTILEIIPQGGTTAKSSCGGMMPVIPPSFLWEERSKPSFLLEE